MRAITIFKFHSTRGPRRCSRCSEGFGAHVNVLEITPDYAPGTELPGDEGEPDWFTLNLHENCFREVFTASAGRKEFSPHFGIDVRFRWGDDSRGRLIPELRAAVEVDDLLGAMSW